MAIFTTDTGATRWYKGAGIMITRIAAPVLVSLALGCEPEAGDPDPPGTLEYEHSQAHLYRLDRRIDVIGVKGDTERRECGALSERAYTELENTLAALDPMVDYGYDPEAQDCAAPPGAVVHIEGFEHSPFACDFECCQTDLARAGLIYWLVESHFEGFEPLVIDGAPYVAIEPDAPCP